MVTKEELVKKINEIEDELSRLEDCGDYSTMAYVTQELIYYQKKLDKLMKIL